ncbi:MAG: hypothetical protein V4463_11245 [Pseudomonadota bacterium]
MKFTLRLLPILLVLIGLIAPAHADAGKPINARLHVTHLSSDKWRADYVLSEPVEAVQFDPAGAYRAQAWRVLTPGMSLEKRDEQERISAGGKRFTAFSVEISLYLPYDLDKYTAFDRFSDGGTDIFLGFLAGSARQGSQERALSLGIQLTGLPDETVIAPMSKNPEEPDYAYFGPAKPVPFGVATIILDPQIPAWLVPEIQQASARVATYFDQAWQRKLASPPLILISLDPLPSKGLSVKGGTFENKIVYRLGGDALQRQGNPVVRRYIVELIAHELSHLWQRNVARGGVGEGEPWVHEGGAEALAVAALEGTGLFTKAEGDAYAAKLFDECAQLQGSVASYRGFYACGFKRFRDYHTDVLALWKNMMNRTEASGEVYSQKMIESLLTPDPTRKP